MRQATDPSAVASRTSASLTTWIAFVVALALALPQPPDAARLAIGAAAGALVVSFGFFLSLRCRRTERRSPSLRVRLATVAFACGAIIGAILLFLLLLFVRVEPALHARFAARAHEPLWRPLALAFESSIIEESIFRLFIMTFLVWIALRFTKNARSAFFVGLAGSALLFGAAHLSAWSGATHAGPILYACVLLLNGAGGILFGWIYWRWGLLYAILSHFAADIVVQGFGPRLLG